jgi:radical SAM family uncharacterized protein
MNRNIERFLAEVEKPARYLGTEWNAVHKERKEGDVLIALAFPDIYEVGMSYLGFKILYHVLNNRADTICERVFAPWIDMEERLRSSNQKLFTLESGRNLDQYDFIGFTLQYEMTYTNILNMLDLGGVPLHAKNRGMKDPFVMGGGPCVFNPEPVADFFDFFVIGEGEEVIHEVVERYIEWKKTGTSRSEFLDILEEVPGIYIPSHYEVTYDASGVIDSVKPTGKGTREKVTKRIIKDLDCAPYPDKPIVPYMDIIHNRIMLEIFRGCTRGCRFCQAGMVYRPVREKGLETLKNQACDQLHSTGYDEIALTSLSTADYSQIRELVQTLIEEYGEQGVGVSLPSLRTDAFSVQIAEQIQKVRKTGLTFAPEAGTQRLRNVINKGVEEADIENAVISALQSGWSAFKFYFMVGLPTETMEDVLGIARIANKIMNITLENEGGKKRPKKITISVASFVPKPWTPFQWEPQDPIEVLQAKQLTIKEQLKDRKINYNYHKATLSFIEAVFARGDRRLGRVLERAWRKGCKFDGWDEHFRFAVWQEAFAEEGLLPEFYANRRRDRNEILPWDHISPGIKKEFLWEEYIKAIEGELTLDCRGNKCTSCGVCPDLKTIKKLAGGKQ